MAASVLALLSVPASIGYPVLFGFVAAESAGALVPGETALIVAGALAGHGELSLPFVIATAAVAAILGDNVGYAIGRNGLRRLLDRPGRLAANRRRAVERGEAFFARYGPAAVFFGRWLPGLRVVVAWLAGAERLAWPRFLLWNALGGLAWAASIGTAAYVLGSSSSGYLGLIGLVGLAGAVVAVAARRLRRRRDLPRKAVHTLERGIVDVAAFVLVAIVVAVVELRELGREAANALAPPKQHH